MTAGLVRVLPAEAPVDLGRDDARLRARVELADPSYDADPSLLERVTGWVLEQLGRLVDQAASVSPGTWVGLLVLAALLLLVVLLVRRRFGPLARTARADRPLFGGSDRSAAAHRAAADEAATAGRYDLAVVERYRGIVRALEERSVLEPRPGRTADEAAGEAGTLLPSLAGRLGTAARLFDGVRYGDRPAGSADDETLRQLDAELSRTRPLRDAVPSPRPAAPR